MNDEPWGDTDPVFHAPSEFVEQSRLQRIERKRRDREELQDLWREERQRRRRERAPLFYRSK